MSVMELLASRRTYRRFEQKAVPQDVVEDIIEALRLSSCGANRQAVRLVVVNRPEDVAKVQPSFQRLLHVSLCLSHSRRTQVETATVESLFVTEAAE